MLPRAGDGDREWKERLRACWYGVEGREFDWCEVNGGLSGSSDGGIHAIVEDPDAIGTSPWEHFAFPSMFATI